LNIGTRYSRRRNEVKEESMSNRILVVDDSKAFLTLMTDLLGAVGYQVATADEASEAIPQAVEFQPGLILMDVEMPDLDGCEACRRVKRHPDLSGIPIVMMSGDSEAAGRAIAAGADAFLPKPFCLDRLLSRIKSLMNQDPSEAWLQEAG
jgi:CheY-like chemotaxis protein